MKILLVGSGGREHALAWAIKRQVPDAQLFIAPGNAGTASLGTNLPLEVTDLKGLLAWARDEKPRLTIVGPEAPLCAGIVDLFEGEGLPIFGPNRAAARLEASKVFTKNFLLKHRLPTAPGAGFSDSAAARAYSQKHPTYPQVLKADGLAAGKGVIIARDEEEASRTISQILDQRIFGDAGHEMVIEEFLPGREMSIHVLTDGASYRLLPISQDHKKLGDGDTGPNTGGMGAYAPAPFATPELQKKIENEVVEPVLQALLAEGIDFRGILYIGLIWTSEGPRILEFNVRGGDPETQILLPLLETPLLEIMHAIREKRLAEVKLQVNHLHAVTVVMAAGGYPGTPQIGVPIDGLDLEMKDTHVFQAGTKKEGDQVVTSGGRVLSVTAWAADLAEARALAYRRVDQIHFKGCQVRRDIAARLTLE